MTLIFAKTANYHSMKWLYREFAGLAVVEVQTQIYSAYCVAKVEPPHRFILSIKSLESFKSRLKLCIYVILLKNLPFIYLRPKMRAHYIHSDLLKRKHLINFTLNKVFTQKFVKPLTLLNIL